MTQTDNDKQEPARTRDSQNDSPVLGFEDQDTLVAYQRRNSRVLWGILSVLLLLVAAVFLLLPRFVSPPSAPAPPASVSTRSQSPDPAQQVSPFEEAQRLREREAAQDVLGELLTLQETLEEQGVEQWAAERFAQALALAIEGDGLYRQQDFAGASARYGEGLAILQSLEASMPDILAALLDAGTAAIAEGDAEAAAEAFNLAMVLAPDSEAADDGLQRALVLEEVLALNEEAAALRESGELRAARERLQEALALDSAHTPSRDALESLEAAIIEADFRGHMSAGYSALAQERPEEAEQRFQQALSVRPGAAEAEAALEQVRDQISSDAISAHLDAAAEHEAEEDWQAALDAYERALTVDANVIAAVDGRERARRRLSLDKYLVGLLADPLQLQDDAVYQQSIKVYTDALTIPAAGSRLREQLREAKRYIEASRVPRTVQLRSDGQTSVTLLRVASLGQFSERSMDLRPGRYAATGVREGYRDVRVEFEVPFDEAPEVITVVSQQAIP